MNQLAIVPTTLLENIISKFPSRHLNFAFAYGSAIFKQAGHIDTSRNMMDFIFAVDNPAEWHKENLSLNRSHYSFLRLFGVRGVTWMQERWGASVYFNTLIRCEGRIIKYGVISTKDLKNDLLDWDSLYVSGRLHKPVQVVKPSADPQLNKAIQTNLENAVHTALLLLPDIFTDREFFETVSWLSYSGDFRMFVGEDKNKISNIVGPNHERFCSLYGPIIDAEENVNWSRTSGRMEQSLLPSAQYHHLNLLPKMLQVALVSLRTGGGRFLDTEEILTSLAHDSTTADTLRKSISDVVRRSSLSQSIKTILTAGIKKSIVYSAKKLTKMWRSS